MKDLKVTIEGKEYPLHKEVYELINTLSLNEIVLKMEKEQYANQRVIEERIRIAMNLEMVVGCLQGSMTSKKSPQHQVEDMIKELKQ